MNCRCCHTKLEHRFVDLGFAPPSNAYVSAESSVKPEVNYPLVVMVCKNCWLVQTKDYVNAAQMFSADYAYFSSTSSSWLEHARKYSENIVERLQLDHTNKVVEIASNDGYLLKNFVSAGIPCLGIEPASATANVAKNAGISVIEQFFTLKLAKDLCEKERSADLIIGNNVLAHVPDINDFVAGLKQLLNPKGSITLEFPHLLKLLENNQFDTIYHEHFSYLSLYFVEKVMRKFGLFVYDVEELTTHGGSLRVFCCHIEHPIKQSDQVKRMLNLEKEFGLLNLSTYQAFQQRIDKVKNAFLTFLIEQKNAGKLVVGYGAAAKGNTLLNYAGVKPDLLPMIFDAAESKQGTFMPGSHIPVLPPAELDHLDPDYILIFPWNIKSEIASYLRTKLHQKVAFVTAIPGIEISR